VSEEAVMGKVVVSQIERGERGGWSWVTTITDDDGYEGVTCHRTNNDGEGLFHRNWEENAWHQSHGHMQYSLPATEAGVRKRLLRMYAEHGEVTLED
jgi:hypothetical protein